MDLNLHLVTPRSVAVSQLNQISKEPENGSKMHKLPNPCRAEPLGQPMDRPTLALVSNRGFSSDISLIE